MDTTSPTAITALYLSLAAMAKPSALPAGWQLTAWGVGERGGTQALVAVRTGTRHYAVAIRGTLCSFTPTALETWLDDFDALVEHRLPGPADCGLSAAADVRGVCNLITMEGRNGQTLPEHLTSMLPEGSTLLITGHSLGGSLASAFTRWIQGRLPGVAVTAYAVDAPAPLERVLGSVL